MTLGDELFALVQGDQGEAFCADDMGDWDQDTVVRRAMVVREIQRELNKKLTAFIRHNKPKPSPRRR